MRVITIVLMLSSVLLLGCEDKDLNSVAQAQACLDEIPYNATSSELYTLAQKCQEYVSGLSTAEANVIKCSAEFIKGGVGSQRITEALGRLDSGSNSEAAFMGALALNGGANPSNLISFCKSSGVAGLQYLSSLSYTGTRMAIAQLGGSYPPAGSDFPANYPTDSAGMISDCQTDTTNCQNAETGQVVYQLKDSYCIGENANSSVCQKIAAASTASNVESSGDYEAFMQQLLNNL